MTPVPKTVAEGLARSSPTGLICAQPTGLQTIRTSGTRDWTMRSTPGADNTARGHVHALAADRAAITACIGQQMKQPRINFLEGNHHQRHTCVSVFNFDAGAIILLLYVLTFID
ncbi:MAG: hypothetical protein FWG56_04260 [Desulfovibrionaceae bacterium]|jgi:hypothetical protein|nr:hypothetical protein [Desulfovibrionaceae bacterium]